MENYRNALPYEWEHSWDLAGLCRYEDLAKIGGSDLAKNAYYDKMIRVGFSRAYAFNEAYGG